VRAGRARGRRGSRGPVRATPRPRDGAVFWQWRRRRAHDAAVAETGCRRGHRSPVGTVGSRQCAAQTRGLCLRGRAAAPPPFSPGWGAGERRRGPAGPAAVRSVGTEKPPCPFSGRCGGQLPESVLPLGTGGPGAPRRRDRSSLPSQKGKAVARAIRDAPRVGACCVRCEWSRRDVLAWQVSGARTRPAADEAVRTVAHAERSKWLPLGQGVAVGGYGECVRRWVALLGRLRSCMPVEWETQRGWAI